MFRTPSVPIIARDLVDFLAGRADAGQMRRGRQRGFLEDPLDRRVGALSGRSAGAVGDRDEARLQRLEGLDRLPQRLLHLLRLRREEFEADLDVAARFGEQRQVPAKRYRSAFMRPSAAVIGGFDAAPEGHRQLAALEMLHLIDVETGRGEPAAPSPRPRSQGGCGRRARAIPRVRAPRSRRRAAFRLFASTRAASAIAVAGECA